ncbi:MAG: M12 family metallopeptidase [Jiangellaceae bacterium]
MAFATSDADARWPDGVIPYVISDDFSTGQRRELLRAIAHWNDRTVIRLRRRFTEADFVRFVPAEGVCQATVGRVGGEQTVGCDVGDGFGTGSVIHEIGHAVGYFHEQQRPDRDQFIRVNTGNIEAGKEHNFDIRMGGVVLGPYDFGSIMHYPEDAFSDGGDTIETLHGEDIGQRDGLSEFDIKGVCVLYDAPHLVVAWEDDLDRRDHRDVQWTGLARWGKHCWGPLPVESEGGGRARPNVALDAERAAFVVYDEGPQTGGSSHVGLRCLTVNGAERFHALTVSSGPGRHQAPDVAVAPVGDLVVAWQVGLPGGGAEVRARGFDREGRDRFPALMVTTGTDGGVPGVPAVGMNPGGGFVVVWGELRDESLSVRGQLYGADGQKVFEQFVVAEGLGDQDVFPRVAVASNSSFVVTWERGTVDIRARGYGADTSELFPEIGVNATAAGTQLIPDVAAHPTGSFVVVWTDDRNENNLGQIRMRAFAADGTEVQPEATANPRGGGDQFRPRVAVDRTGRRYVVWEDDEDRNGVFQIHAQGTDADGASFLDSFTVNVAWRGQQRRPAVATR